MEWKGGRGRRLREGRGAWAEREVRRERGGARDREGEGVWVWMCGMEAGGGSRTHIRRQCAMYGRVDVWVQVYGRRVGGLGAEGCIAGAGE